MRVFRKKRLICNLYYDFYNLLTGKILIFYNFMHLFIITTNASIILIIYNFYYVPGTDYYEYRKIPSSRSSHSRKEEEEKEEGRRRKKAAIIKNK